MQQNTSRVEPGHPGFVWDDAESAFGPTGADKQSRAVRSRSTRVLVLGSFPPRECGIATFTKDVVDSLAACADVQCDVIAIDEPGSEARTYGRRVVARLTRDDVASYTSLAALINAHPAPILLVQHEYGLFGGEDGASFLKLLAAVRKPVVVVLHTILTAPNAHHRAVTQRICAGASAIVVLSHTGKDILKRLYSVNENSICIIPHGVPDVPFTSTACAKQQLGLGDRTIISTFGLLSRGKGLEDAINAMSTISVHHPAALYLILGQTHPLVRQHEGNSYRDELTALVNTHGLHRNVAFVDRFLSFDDLMTYLSSTDIYLTPSLNADQIVSGTLAYALGCGKAIVSTPYLYAKEVLAQKRGVLCQFRDAASIAAAVDTLLTYPLQRQAIARRAYDYGHAMRWSNVAASYWHLLRDVISDVQKLSASHGAVGRTLQMLAVTAT
jgi:glycosyltransferase involved in cell wall biosynthesis